MTPNSWSSLQLINNRRIWICKKNSLFNLTSNQTDINKIYLYNNYPYEVKFQLLINKRENTNLKHLNNSKAFTEYSNDMDDIYKNIKEYNPKKNVDCF